ncbi:MAG: hypothetical protein AAFO04_27265 [Cyanobacteria bacterium J06592_8]
MTYSTLTSQPNRFLSFTELRKKHNELRQHQPSDYTPQFITEVDEFLRRGQATGSILDDEDDRWATQSLLDYWASILYREGHKPPNTTLIDFDPSQAPKLPDDSCPYLGLEAFHEKNHHLFYGRQRLLNKMLNHLRNHHFLAVIGSSGSGKSSTVRGGLIPSLKSGQLTGSETWQYYPPMVPGSHPLKYLACTLYSTPYSTSQTREPEMDAWVTQQIEGFQGDSNYLLNLLNQHSSQPGVLVIDQFEETFTLCSDAQIRQAFIENLLTVIQSPENRHFLIVTMRTDFESRVAQYSELQQAFENGEIRVTPMDVGELREAIEKPAKSVGLKFEAGLVDELLNDVLGEPAALPLLQFTLWKLWENRQRNRVTLETYKRLGGGRLTLSNAADEFYDALIPEDQIATQRILLKMVKPTEDLTQLAKGLEFTSSRISRQLLYQDGEAKDRIDRVLNKLIEARLVRLMEGEQSDDAQVEVAHEALVRNWPRFVGWLDDERTIVRNRLQLKSTAEQWQEWDHDPSVLWRGALLQDARNYQNLSEVEQEFVEQSLKAEREEREKELALEQKLHKTPIIFISRVDESRRHFRNRCYSFCDQSKGESDRQNRST